jgi:DNA-directed RNA polymerase specialized sigma24 family protein
MADESDDLEYLVALFKQEYATLHRFLARRTSEPKRVGDVLQNAVVSASSCTARPRTREFALYVVRIVLNSLGSRYGAERTEDLGAGDLDAVLADNRKLFTSTVVSVAVLEQVTNSFPSSTSRNRQASIPCWRSKRELRFVRRRD